MAELVGDEVLAELPHAAAPKINAASAAAQVSPRARVLARVMVTFWQPTIQRPA